MKLVAALFGLIVAAGPANAQNSIDARTRAIVASFNKSKHVVKSKRGITVEKYKRIESSPSLRADPASYSGTYAVNDEGYELKLRVSHDGKVEGTGEEPLASSNIMTRFTISGTISGALLTATKTYANGSREKLEGAFINSTSYESPTDRGHTMFGLGVITSLRDLGGVTSDRLFYQQVRD